MGAAFVTRVLPGTLSQAEVRERFRAMQEQDRYENGHSYSGSIGMADGLEFRSNQFETDEEAREWLDDNAEKFGPALCIKRTNAKGEPIWVIGASCSS
jgi:hypothetical protein